MNNLNKLTKAIIIGASMMTTIAVLTSFNAVELPQEQKPITYCYGD